MLQIKQTFCTPTTSRSCDNQRDLKMAQNTDFVKLFGGQDTGVFINVYSYLGSIFVRQSITQLSLAGLGRPTHHDLARRLRLRRQQERAWVANELLHGSSARQHVEFVKVSTHTSYRPHKFNRSTSTSTAQHAPWQHSDRSPNGLFIPSRDPA